MYWRVHKEKKQSLGEGYVLLVKSQSFLFIFFLFNQVLCHSILLGLDPGQLEACGLFHEEEEMEGTQGRSPVKETPRSSSPENLGHASQTDRKLKSTGSVCDISEVRWCSDHSVKAIQLQTSIKYL